MKKDIAPKLWDFSISPFPHFLENSPFTLYGSIRVLYKNQSGKCYHNAGPDSFFWGHFLLRDKLGRIEACKFSTKYNWEFTLECGSYWKPCFICCLAMLNSWLACCHYLSRFSFDFSLLFLVFLWWFKNCFQSLIYISKLTVCAGE